MDSVSEDSEQPKALMSYDCHSYDTETLLILSLRGRCANTLA